MRKDLESVILKKKLKRVRQPKNDVEAVIRHLIHQDVNLTASQDQLCTRLMYVDTLIRERQKTTDEIIEALKEKFGTTLYRAQQDIYDCHKVFGDTRRLNKNYVLSHHIDDIRLMIKKIIDAKEYSLLPKFYDNLTYAVNSLPVVEDAKDAPPTQIIMVYNGAPPVEQKPLEDVLAEADNLLKPTVDGEYIDYEEDTAAQLSSDVDPDDTGE
jgi:hypothetical protein